MAIQQSQKQSDLEKRLKILRQQVYGKSRESSQIKSPFYSVGQPTSAGGGNTTTNIPDLNYLYKDLSRILVLSGLALATQILLFILANNHIIKLGFW